MFNNNIILIKQRSSLTFLFQLLDTTNALKKKNTSLFTECKIQVLRSIRKTCFKGQGHRNNHTVVCLFPLALAWTSTSLFIMSQSPSETKCLAHSTIHLGVFLDRVGGVGIRRKRGLTPQAAPMWGPVGRCYSLDGSAETRQKEDWR